MNHRISVNPQRGSLAPAVAGRRPARSSAALWLAAALCTAYSLPSQATGVAGAHAGLSAARGPVASTLVASGDRLALGALDPSSPSTADEDRGGSDATGLWRLGVETVPMRSVPGPSELALLGDGLLVLIAWVAGRQARRSRSMAAMTDDHTG